MSGTLEGRGAGARSARQHHARIGTSISPAPRNRSCRAAVRWPVRGERLAPAPCPDPRPAERSRRADPDLGHPPADARPRRALRGETPKTRTRGVNCLQDAGLLAREGSAVRPYLEQMFAFLPLRKQAAAGNEEEILAALAASSVPNPADPATTRALPG